MNEPATYFDPVTVVIDGPAVAKGRPRMTRRGIAYTPAATRKYEAHGRLAAQLAMMDRAPIATAAKLAVLIELPIPSSWSRRRQQAALSGDIRPTTRPDIDNYVKAALDAINGVVITDDSIITELAARKRYGLDPKLILTVAPVAEAGA
jgi:Holliday junction resolvase RusA-like endonuclease